MRRESPETAVSPPPVRVAIRPALPEDAEAVARIYNHGIAERQATFETRPRTVEEVLGWFAQGRPFLVATDETATVRGFARLTPYSTRKAYAGIGEHGIYVDPAARGNQIGLQLLNELANAAESAGYYKLTSRIFTTNEASLRLHRRAGFTEVGIQRRHGRLDGEWKDTMLVERLLGEAAAGLRSS
jgi:L-amino acid N-acyltransferase YncA